MKKHPKYCVDCGDPLPKFEQEHGTSACYGCDMESVSRVNMDDLYVAVYVDRPCGQRVVENAVWSSEAAAKSFAKKVIKKKGVSPRSDDSYIKVVHLKEELERGCSSEDPE